MDEIIDCEMKGLTLAEDKLKVPHNFVSLIRHIFPALSVLLPENLNSSYCKVTTSRQALKAEGTCRSTRLESHALKPAAQSRSAKKSDHLIAGKGIYNVKTNKWKWQEVVPREIHAHITDDDFSHPFASSGALQARGELELEQAV